MNIIVNGRNLDITPALRDYAESKVMKFDKYLSGISEATIILSTEKFRQKAEVLLKANGVMIQAASETEDIYASIDEVVEKIEKQVKKHKGKVSAHRKENRLSKRTEVPPLPEESIEEPRIIQRRKLDTKPMSPEEAAMQMELLERDFLVFTNAATGTINVLYRRGDGNLELIEPA
ncbi:MAG TPA: ribosome-associated translation inhibitor RaiA [Nitrospirae bacterium]|nr:ribosome-associated translation inhibitor RaiA [Nitrospirota bacterium]